MLAILNFVSILFVWALSLEVACALDRDPNRAVISYFIVGNTYSYTEDDWNQAFDLASKAEIDAFVFNIAQDEWRDRQLEAAFKVAQNHFTKICFGFDFIAAPWNTASVTAILQRYVGKPGYYRYNGKGGGKGLVTTFFGAAAANVDWVAVKGAVPDIYVVPHLSPDDLKKHPPGTDGVMNWNAWATRNNLPIDGNSSTVDDLMMSKELGKEKAYATLVSPSSFTNYPFKSWVFKSDELLVNRWNQMLTFSTLSEDAHIDLIELYSWNDYGETNYMNDILKSHDDEFFQDAKLWCKGFKHDGWRLLSTPFTRAFKAGQTAVTSEHIDEEIVVFQHRPYPAKSLCTGQGQPILGANFIPDQVTIISMLKSPVELVIKSGDVTTQAQAAAGVDTHRVPMQLGSQSVSVMRDGKNCGEVTSTLEVKGGCETPNFNPNVETIFVKCGDSPSPSPSSSPSRSRRKSCPRNNTS